MADYWTVPKVNWVAGDGVAYTDLNRIEANTSAVRDATHKKVQDFGYATYNGSGSYDGILYIKAGSCYSNNGFPIRSDADIIKNLNSWQQGSGQSKGGMAPVVTVAADTWYYIFAICDPSDGSVDVMFDDNVSGSHVSSGTYTEKRYIGAFKTRGAGAFGSFYTCEMYSFGDDTFINFNNMFTSGDALTFPNSAGIDDSFQTITLQDQSVNAEGYALPAREVKAYMLLSCGTFTTSYSTGLLSRISRGVTLQYTIPGTLVVGGIIQGEVFKNVTVAFSGQEAELMINSSRQLSLGMKSPATDGSTIFHIRGFHDERTI